MRDILISVLKEGGPVLWGLLALAAALFGMFAVTWSGLRRVRAGLEVGVGSIHGEFPPKRREIERAFAAYELDELAWVERRLPVLAVMTASAPLLGLLGTVAGMLQTFGGLASAGQGEMSDMVSAGISKALVTTQAGLILAVPAVFLLAWLRWSTGKIHNDLRRRLHAALAGAPRERRAEP